MNKDNIKPFFHNGKPFMPYPQRKPRDYTPILVLTKEDKVYDVIQIDTGFEREFINELEHTLLFQNEIKGWWYK